MSVLVLQSFGRENEYKRAILTILSYFAYVPTPYSNSKALLFTDNPNYFGPYLSDLPVEYVLLTPEKIRTMRGEIDFLHRMKIAMIEEAFERSEGPLLYADSDTFFLSDPSSLMRSLSPEKSYMHLREYSFDYLKTLKMPAAATFHEFVELIETTTFRLADGSAFNVTADMFSWNAGVMLFHPSHRRFIPDVYALTEQFYPATRNHASEQYAFSLVLQTHTDLQACEPVIYHYWYRIKKQIADVFLDKQLSALKELDLERKLGIVRGWTKQIPLLFEEHEIALRDNAVQAFNENRFSEGYRWTFRALTKSPISDKVFVKDVLYHTKRWLRSKRK
jgi:hypothetical protein